mmetsp:Transcript_10474/g.19284  ORF Transcript_10474/g.19284 Transcript_10474/m.19284 type:complete len:406 (+) Transcript_10474:87-1304(+)
MGTANDAVVSYLVRFAILIALPHLAITASSHHKVLVVQSDGNFRKRPSKRPSLRGRPRDHERMRPIDSRFTYLHEARSRMRKTHRREHHIPWNSSDPDVLYRATHRMECLRKKPQKTNITITTQRIPSQLVLTGRNASLDGIHPAALANIKNVSARSPNLSIRWLGDQACLEYLSKHFDDELQQFFRNEVHGAFRGDICRSAVLLREGGFYMDLDVQLVMPLTALIDNATTFMAVYEAPEMSVGGMLNALMAVEPGSAVMNATLHEIRRWYRKEVNTTGWMGPVTLMRGLHKVVRDTCPCESVNLRKKVLHWHDVEPQWQCGSHFFRFNVQRHLLCENPGSGRPYRASECPESRRTSRAYAVRQGFFMPGRKRQLIGWPRPAWCSKSGCGYGGLDDHNISDETPI